MYSSVFFLLHILIVSVFQVASSFHCPRRSVLDDRLKSNEYSTSALTGTLLHQVFQVVCTKYANFSYYFTIFVSINTTIVGIPDIFFAFVSGWATQGCSFTTILGTTSKGSSSEKYRDFICMWRQDSGQKKCQLYQS